MGAFKDRDGHETLGIEEKYSVLIILNDFKGHQN